MKRLAAVALLIVSCLLLVGPVNSLLSAPAGQKVAETNPAPDQLPSPKTTLRVTTTLIEVTVVAREKHGQLVTDLKQDNFEIYDEGKRQKIQFFTVQRAGSPPAQGVPPTPPASVASRTSPARTFSNRSSESLGPNAVTVILIDEIDMWCEEWPWARSQITHFLRQVQPGDRIGIYLMSWGGISVLHRVTQDCSTLIKQLASWKGEFGQNRRPCAYGEPLSRTNVGADFSVLLNGPEPGPGGIGVQNPYNSRFISAGNPSRDPAIRSLQIFAAIANHLAGIPGRKNLIWVSDGFPLVGQGRDPEGNWEPISFHAYEQRTMRVVNGANVAIYSLEAEGLNTLLDEPSPSVGRLPLADAANPHPDPEMIKAVWRAISLTHLAMLDVSDRSGGRAFIDTNDLTGSIRTAFDDSHSTYTLGFYPEAPRFDGQFHQIRVKVVGRPDVSLIYRKGYVDAHGTGDPKQQLQDAVWSPLDGNGIALTAEMTPRAAGYDLILRVGLDGLDLELDGRRRKGTVRVVLVQNDDEGGRYNYLDQTLDLSLTQSMYEKMLKSGLSFRRTVAMNPKATSLRVIVVDQGSGNLGSVTIPVNEVRRGLAP